VQLGVDTVDEDAMRMVDRAVVMDGVVEILRFAA